MEGADLKKKCVSWETKREAKEPPLILSLLNTPPLRGLIGGLLLDNPALNFGGDGACGFDIVDQLAGH